jgi:hypothetical protein
MQKALKITGLVVGVLLALVVFREAFFGYTAYFVIVPGAKLYADGKAISGSLHKGDKGRAFILTRSGDGKPESYWIAMPSERNGWISSCGGWAAPRFPLVAIGDVNPPCFSFVNPNLAPKSLERKPTFGPRFVEFTADDGRRIKTSW